MSYAAAAMAIVACPFCREMFEEGEESTCPVCGVALTAFEKLPPSHDAESEDGTPLAPEHEVLAPTYLRRGKGALAVLAVFGLFFFFIPWIHVTLPDTIDLTGFSLARRLGWTWGAAVSWVVLVPTVLSRRTIVQMRGARAAAAFLSSVPAVTIGILLARPPHSGLVPLRFEYGWAIWASLFVSIVATVWSLRLGGRIDDIQVSRGTSVGQSVH